MTNAKLEINNNLLMQVIKRQAGTFEKAILEGNMNSIEAGADKVENFFIVDDDDNAQFRLVDNGRGISTKKEIIEHFQTFGTPHKESENKKWAQFRMGRGQLFAFGKNIWRTATFKMEVDINEWGLDYRLTENLPHVDGCSITVDLYENPIGEYGCRTIETLASNVKKQILYMETPIFFNGEQINTPASGLNWDFETDEAYYLFNAGSNWKFYNMGAFVMEWPANRAGVVGAVVSKKMLKVNFARNDIQHDCEIFKDIQGVMKENKIKKVRKARRMLNAADRENILLSIRDADIPITDVINISVIDLANGKRRSLADIRKIRSPWSFADHGSLTADRLIESDRAIVFSNDIFDLLDYTGDEQDFFSWLMRGYFSNYLSLAQKSDWSHLAGYYKSFDSISEGYNETLTIIPTKKQTVVERRVLKALAENNWGDRNLMIGSSNTASAWTDGHSYIVIAREFLSSLYFSSSWSAASLIHTMFHELAHNDSDESGCVHSPVFYENFYSLTSRGSLAMIAEFCDTMRRFKAEEKVAALIEKENKAQAKLDAKLNKKKGIKPRIAASMIPAAVVAIEVEDAELVSMGPKIHRRKRRR